LGLQFIAQILHPNLAIGIPIEAMAINMPVVGKTIAESNDMRELVSLQRRSGNAGNATEQGTKY
jgi:hypothetical protein